MLFFVISASFCLHAVANLEAFGTFINTAGTVSEETAEISNGSFKQTYSVAPPRSENSASSKLDDAQQSIKLGSTDILNKTTSSDNTNATKIPNVADSTRSQPTSVLKISKFRPTTAVPKSPTVYPLIETSTLNVKNRKRPNKIVKRSTRASEEDKPPVDWTDKEFYRSRSRNFPNRKVTPGPDLDPITTSSQIETLATGSSISDSAESTTDTTDPAGSSSSSSTKSKNEEGFFYENYDPDKVVDDKITTIVYASEEDFEGETDELEKGTTGEDNGTTESIGTEQMDSTTSSAAHNALKEDEDGDYDEHDETESEDNSKESLDEKEEEEDDETGEAADIDADDGDEETGETVDDEENDDDAADDDEPQTTLHPMSVEEEDSAGEQDELEGEESEGTEKQTAEFRAAPTAYVGPTPPPKQSDSRETGNEAKDPPANDLIKEVRRRIKTFKFHTTKKPTTKSLRRRRPMKKRRRKPMPMPRKVTVKGTDGEEQNTAPCIYNVDESTNISIPFGDVIRMDDMKPQPVSKDNSKSTPRKCSQWCKCVNSREDLLCETIGCMEDDIPKFTETCAEGGISKRFSWVAHFADRGKCLCYGGEFLCERPEDERYYLDVEGAFFVVGYSENEAKWLVKKIRNPEANLGNESTVSARITRQLNKLLQDYSKKCMFKMVPTATPNIVVVQVSFEVIYYVPRPPPTGTTPTTKKPTTEASDYYDEPISTTTLGPIEERRWLSNKYDTKFCVNTMQALKEDLTPDSDAMRDLMLSTIKHITIIDNLPASSAISLLPANFYSFLLLSLLAMLFNYRYN